LYFRCTAAVVVAGGAVRGVSASDSESKVGLPLGVGVGSGRWEWESTFSSKTCKEEEEVGDFESEEVIDAVRGIERMSLSLFIGEGGGEGVESSLVGGSCSSPSVFEKRRVGGDEEMELEDDEDDG